MNEDDKEIVDPIVEYLRVLAVCHTVVPEIKDEKLIYQAQSPDEAALCSAARSNNFTFVSRRTSSVTVNEMGIDRDYQLLNLMEFTSDRARMSIIVRTPEGKIMLYSKGIKF